MKYLFLVIFFFTTFLSVKAQIPKFSEDPAVFISEVGQMMATTRNDNAANVANLLEMAWNSGNISQDQKAHIIKFSKALQAKKYRPRPHFENYFAAIGSAVNVHDFKGAQLTQLLDVIDKTYEKEEPKTVEQFMATTARFLATKALYRTTTNGLRIIGGTFNFEYRYGNEVDDEPVAAAPKKTVPAPAQKPAAKKTTPTKKPAKPKNDGWDDWSGWEEETPAETKKEDDGWGTIPDNQVKAAPGQEVGVAQYLTEDMPVMKGPVIVVKDADLAISSQYDSVTIKKTNGVVSLLRNVFVGRGGTFEWDVNGNPASAALKRYTFNITRPEFKAEGAALTYPAVLEEPIEGIFEYKAKKRNTTADTGFPRFASFTNDAKIKNLGPDLGYRGGFSLAGAKIMSAALDGSFSYLSAKIGDVRKFKASSRSFSLGDTLIAADRAGITIYQEKDSITHPGMGFKFSRGRNLLKMVENNNSAFKESPFVDSYHKMEITADMLAWKLEQPEINFSIVSAKEQVPAQVESYDYFSNTRYQQMKGISSFHPLQMIVGYSQLKKKDRFYAMDVARDNKIKEIAVKRAMSSLARNGYIDYNSTTGFIILKPKAIHYVMAHRDKKDFDHISIKSRSASGKNATLNLDNKILMLRGVRQFAFSSDSGSIVVRPDSGIVRVKKNRDMDFNGRVVTPNFIFKGSDFKFSYNDYWIDMVKIDSLIFRTKKGRKGAKEKVDVAGANLSAAEIEKAKELRARAVADSLAMVAPPEDFPEDDSVLIRKKMEAKSAKKLAKQKAKEEKKKAKALAKAKKAKKKKPQLDEWGDPIIEEQEDQAYADADPAAPVEAAPVIKKPKPTGPTEKALTGLTGKLYLNKPTNKSGRKKIPGYPMFDASTGAVVYFNKPDVLGGAYDSSMYFTIPPFKLDSVGSSSQTAVNFKGTFHSGDILPPIETRLTVMPDQSLGFEYIMPKDGMPLYGGKGKAMGNVVLNGNGLQTKGAIAYLTTTIKSDTFTLYMDSVTTIAGTSGAIAANSTFPEAKIGRFSMNWHVSEDRMALNKPDSLFNKETTDPIKLYNDKFAYSGQAVVTPSGLLGNGTVENEETVIKSPLFNFQQDHFKGNNATMAIKSANPDMPALLATDVQLDYSLKRGSANFAPEKVGFASTELPNAQFKTSLSGGNWDFKKKIVTMNGPENKEDLTGSYFYSTNPEQDTLKFNAASALYDLSNFTLKAGGVPYIVSNDAYIYPADGNVEITENADIKVLTNSRLVMDSLNLYHELVKGEIDIMSKKEFQGTATLMYKNSQDATFPIQFNSFTRDSMKVEKGEPPVYFTKAIGSVFEETNLQLLPKVLYKGDVFMTSNKKLLDFEGEMKLNFGSAASSDWFPYKNTVDPDSIRVTIKDMKTIDNEPLVTGLHISSGSSDIYSTFVSIKGDPTDLDMFLVDGLLSYDKMTQEFRLGNAARAYGESYEGNVMAYNDSTKVSKYEGSFNLIKSNKDFSLKSSGEMRAKLDSANVRFDSFLAFDINLPSQAWAQMGEMIADNAGGAMEAIVNGTTLFYKLGEFIGNKAVIDYANRTSGNYVPFPSVSPKLVHNMVFNEVKFRWSKKNKAWYSVGNLGLANIGKKDINAMMGGHIEIRRIGETDNVTIYLEANPTTWYYFNYYENALIVASSDHKFNQILAPKLKPAGTLAMTYTPIQGETIDRNVFVKSFRNSYLGGKGAPLVDAPAPIVDEPPTDEYGQPLEEGNAKKKNKKGKKDDTGTEDGYSEPPVEEPPVEEPPVESFPAEEEPAKKKKEKKKKEKTEEPPMDAPVEEPPMEDYPAEEEPVKKKKEKKKKKSDEEETEADMDMAP